MSRFVFTELTLHHFFGSDFDVRDRIEPHAGFWNGVLAAQQEAGFISLGRLYDQEANAHTIAGLLKFAKTYPGLFREDSLRQRKVITGMSPDQAQEFARGTFTATRRTFEELAEAHVVKEAARMIVWLKRAPLPERRIDDAVLASFMRAMELEPFGLKPEDFDADPDRSSVPDDADGTRSASP